MLDLRSVLAGKAFDDFKSKQKSGQSNSFRYAKEYIF